MKKAIIIETREELIKILIQDDFIRDDASTQKVYYSQGDLVDGTIVLGKGTYAMPEETRKSWKEHAEKYNAKVSRNK